MGRVFFCPKVPTQSMSAVAEMAALPLPYTVVARAAVTVQSG